LNETTDCRVSVEASIVLGSQNDPNFDWGERVLQRIVDFFENLKLLLDC
jgi:hypothetical protein